MSYLRPEFARIASFCLYSHIGFRKISVQVWYFIVLIPDLCCLSYFAMPVVMVTEILKKLDGHQSIESF